MEKDKTINVVITKSSRVADICQISLMAAIIFVTTWFIHLPSHMGVIHLGDSMVFTAALIFPRKKAVAASAIGMMLFDILSGYAMWAPFTFIIKGVMALIVSLIAFRKDYNGDKTINNILAFICASLWMILAYYLGGVILSYFYFKMDVLKSIIIPLADIPGNILQVTAGILIAIPLSKALMEALKKAHISF